MLGEIAEMVLEGLMCQRCGSWMEDLDSPGYPRSCDSCSEEEVE